MPQLPNVPTVGETVPGFEYIGWNGYAITGGVAEEVKNRLAKALQDVAHNPEVLNTFESLGIESAGTSPEQAIESIRKDIPKYEQIVDMAGLRRNDK
jgi:tripartite-type tricarboxylate transporter receptor subunit TctC